MLDALVQYKKLKGLEIKQQTVLKYVFIIVKVLNINHGWK